MTPHRAEVRATPTTAPEHEARFAGRYTHRSEARRRFGALADLYASYYHATDELADAAASALRSHSELRAPLYRALETRMPFEGNGALRAFTDALLARPAWVNEARLHAGARAFQRMGVHLFTVLGSWSLLNGYRSSAAVKPLAMTKRLTEAAPVRLAETGRYVAEVCKPGNILPGRPGFTISARVRLMHAFVRASLRDRPDWRTEEWGLPINQGDMLGTIIEFSSLVIQGARIMGYQHTPEEQHDMMHLFRYAGFLMGVDAVLLRELETVDRASHVAELMNLIQPPPDEDSLALADALCRLPMDGAQTPMDRMLAPVITRVQAGMMWVFNEPEVTMSLRVPHASYRHLLKPLRASVGVMESFRRRIPFGTEAAVRLGAYAQEQHVRRTLAGHRPDFTSSGPR